MPRAPWPFAMFLMRVILLPSRICLNSQMSFPFLSKAEHNRSNQDQSKLALYSVLGEPKLFSFLDWD